MTSTPTPAVTSTDVLIIGAGPAGLSLACTLADAGLHATLFERQPRAALADPPPDGRDIALTHRAVGLMRQLGLWERIDAAEVSPLREAHVIDGDSPQPLLHFDPRGSGKDALGFLVPNHAIRRAAYEAAMARAGVELIAEAAITDSGADGSTAHVALADGRRFEAPLLVAADSRYSETRRHFGIGAEMRDFGRTVIVCRMTHEREHDAIAHECFHYGRTMALLPINGRQVSVVITAPTQDADALLRLPVESFETLVRERLKDKLGTMTLIGKRHSYPLVAVYAHRFVGPRFALIGDAAVGMHPVTAHGFNFGLYGVTSLTRALRQARSAGQDIGALRVLERYDSEHRRVTLPIYLGTNAVVKLFTDDRPPARLARSAVLRIAERLPPVKALITRQLTGTPMSLPTWLAGR